MLEMRTLEHKKLELIAQGHTANKRHLTSVVDMFLSELLSCHLYPAIKIR